MAESKSKAEVAADADAAATTTQEGARTGTEAQPAGNEAGLAAGVEAADGVKYGTAEAQPIVVATSPGASDGKLTDAQKAQAQDNALRRENPDKVVYRKADEKIGGQSFEYGQPAAVKG